MGLWIPSRLLRQSERRSLDWKVRCIHFKADRFHRGALVADRLSVEPSIVIGKLKFGVPYIVSMPPGPSCSVPTLFRSRPQFHRRSRPGLGLRWSVARYTYSRPAFRRNVPRFTRTEEGRLEVAFM